MTIDVDILIETYLSLREYIPAKDRQEASDHIMSFLADSLGDKELTDFSETDSYTKRSYEEYVVGSDESFEDEDDSDDEY
jgi:hypothetical protein